MAERHLKRVFALFSALLIAGYAGRAYSLVTLFSWGSSHCNDLQDFDGTPLPDGDIVYFINAGPNGVPDPITPGCGGPVCGDDELLIISGGDATTNPRYIERASTCPLFGDQLVSKTNDFSNMNPGDVVFFRVFDAPDPASAPYYGDSPTHVVTGNGDTADATPSGPWRTATVNPLYTPVTLMDFSAVSFGGGILLTWRTGSEVGNQGFRVLRAESPDGPFLDVTSSLVPSRALEPGGAEYAFIDWTVQPGKTYYYMLEDIPSDGMPGEHGPVESSSGSLSAPVLEVKELENGVEISLMVRGLDVRDSNWGKEIYIPGFSFLEETGSYRVPITQVEVAVPPEGDVTLKVVDSSYAEVYSISMSPYTAIVPQDPSMGAVTSPAPSQSSIHSPAELAVLDFLRGQRIAHILLSPVKYIPERHSAVIYTSLTVRLEWSGGGSRSIDPGYENVFSGLGNYRSALNMRTERKSFALSKPSSALRVRTGENIIYRISENTISSMLNIAGSNYVIKGIKGEVPFLHAGGDLIFMGGSGDGFYSSTSSFLIYPGSPTRSPVSFSSAPLTGGPFQTEVLCSEPIGAKTRYIASLPSLEPEEKWVWLRVFRGLPERVTARVPSYAGGPVTLRTLAVNPGSAYAEMSISVNGHYVSSLGLDPGEVGEVNVQIPASLIQGNSFELTFETASGTYVAVKPGLLKYNCTTDFQGQFPFEVTLEGDYAFYTTSGPPFYLLSITNGEIQGVSTDFSYSETRGALTAHLVPGRYVLASLSGIPEVDHVERARFIEDPSDAVDYVAIYPAQFEDALEPLLLFREGEGMNVAGVHLQDVFDTFSAGNTSPHALKDFIKYAYENWGASFVLLVGDFSYDCMGIYAKTWGDTGESRCLLPSMMVNTSYYNLSVPSDDLLASVSGDDPIPEVAVGRLPVIDESELEEVVSTILSYENADADAVYRKIKFFTDEDDMFESTAHDLMAHIPGEYSVSISSALSLGSERMSQAITREWHEGALFLHYIGHGSVIYWGRSAYFSSEVLYSFSTSHPVILAPLDCFNAFFADPVNVPIGELALLTGNAALVWASSGATTLPAQRNLYLKFIEAIFEKNIARLGLADVYAKTYMKRAGDWQDVVKTWVLLGDPALNVKVKKSGVTQGSNSWPPPLPPEAEGGGSVNPGSDWENTGGDFHLYNDRGGAGCTFSHTSGDLSLLLLPAIILAFVLLRKKLAQVRD